MSSCFLYYYDVLFFSQLVYPLFLFFFFFNDTATTEIYTLSLHDALPISSPLIRFSGPKAWSTANGPGSAWASRVTVLPSDGIEESIGFSWRIRQDLVLGQNCWIFALKLALLNASFAPNP